MKLLLFFSIITFCLYCLHATTMAMPSLSMDQSRPVIAWDLHGVVFQKQVWQMGKKMAAALLKADNKWQLISIMIKPSFWTTIYALSCDHQQNSTSIIDVLIRKHPALTQHRSAILSIVNAYTPDASTIELIKKLKNNGYRNIVASNIAQESFAIMQQRYPEVFALFDGFFIACTKKMADPKTMYSTNLKPNTEYYKGLRNYTSDLGIPQTTPLIFIDDRQENISAALDANVGIQPILFSNAQQTSIAIEKIVTTDKQFYSYNTSMEHMLF